MSAAEFNQTSASVVVIPVDERAEARANQLPADASAQRATILERIPLIVNGRI